MNYPFYNYYDNFFFGCNGKINDTKKALFDKNWTAKNVFYKMLDLLITRFKWKIPKSCDERFLEFCLLVYNQAGFAKIKQKINDIYVEGYMNLQPLTQSLYSPYGYPISISLVDYMGRNYGSNFVPILPQGGEGANMVLCLNSKCNTPPVYRVMWYAERITQILISIKAAIENTSGSVIIQCDKEQKKAIDRAIQESRTGKPLIISTDKNDQFMEPRIMTNPQTPEIIKTLYECLDKEWANFYAEFGINANAVMNKMSGVSDMELIQNEESTSLALQAELDCRKLACEQFKELFGEEISVELNFTKRENTEEKTEDEIIEEKEDEENDI